MATTFSVIQSTAKNQPNPDIKLSLTSFYGGALNGRCLQIHMFNKSDFDGRTQYLNFDDVRKLRDELSYWLQTPMSLSECTAQE